MNTRSDTGRRLTRRAAVQGGAAAAALAGAAGLATVTPALAQSDGGAQLVGAWDVTLGGVAFRRPLVRQLWALAAGGVLLAFDGPAESRPGAPAGEDDVVYSTPFVGSWRIGSDGRLSFQGAQNNYSRSSELISRELWVGTLDLDAGGQRLAGPTRWALVDAAGATLVASELDISAVRLNVSL